MKKETGMLKKHNSLIAVRRLLLLALLVSPLTSAFSQVRLPQIITNGMVLQRDAKLNIWGWASPGEKITVSFNNKRYKATTSAEGKWLVELPAMKAGGPHRMTISAKNTITLEDIMMGDVWFCSGQSNMVHQLNIHDVTYADEIANANYPEIRQFLVPTRNSLTGPIDNLADGSWSQAVSEEVRPFSAVAYFFAKRINDKYHVPIGLINASVGGTPIEAWTSEEGFKEFPSILQTIENNKDTAYVNAINRKARPSQPPKQPEDKGLTGPKPWYAVDFVPNDWRTINIPGYWEDQGAKDLNGIVWYRKEIEVPASMAGKEAKVFLGRIVDADVLYINGKEVGNKTYQYPQRRYPVPAGLLKAGKNVFVVKVANYNGKGGFVPDKPYCVFAGSDTVDLKGYWQYKVGAVFAPRPSSPPGINAQSQPTALFNAMVAPVTNYRIKGILWYQGESNAGKPVEYADLLPALINDWRTQFDYPNAPFVYAQLPNFMEVNYLPSESNWAILRESQLKGLAVPNTAMTVNIDLGEWNDIHPDNKKDVGERMALAALKIAYGEAIVYSGPLYENHSIEGNKITISFSHTGGGLTTDDGEALSEFAIAGADKKFVWAQAKIEGDKVIVWSDELAEPKFVRYAWADNPDNPNLYNQEGLPASPFRTDQ
ncbi:MAG: sialate O-acetylesterase [Imperialibacter sp.]|uniref:sialate O-acetylesterase n=1 Tax=Imperialibacter sp. TaxID=2038411 RepID=UPI0032EFD5B5